MCRPPSRTLKTWFLNKGKTLSLLLAVCAVFGLFFPSQAGNYFCSKSFTAEIELDPEAGKTEVLIPTDSDGNPVQQCHWPLKLARFNGARQMVLQGVPAHDRSGITGFQLQYQIHMPANGNDSAGLHSVFSGLFQVLSVTHRTHLDVSLNVSSQPAQSSPSVRMRIEMPVPQSCARDMLSYRNSCFAVSSVPQNLTAVMSSIRGDAQLASFASMDEVEEFVAANKARRSKHPFSSPLNLSQPIRLGMFRGQSDTAVLAAHRNDSGCELLPFKTSQEMKANESTGICVSLHVDKKRDKASLVFGDCSQPMLWLLSFPEMPSGRQPWESCGLALKLDDLHNGPIQKPYLTIAVLTVVGAILLITAALVAIVAPKLCVRRQKSCVILEELESRKQLEDAKLNELTAEEQQPSTDTETHKFMENEA